MNLDRILGWLSSVAASVTRALTPMQIASLALTFLAVVGLTVGAAYWISAPTYRVLFSDMDPESAAAVVEDLRAAEVSYRLDPGGRTVSVPARDLDELRLQFASDGQLPSSGRIGFEIFDRTAFGATEFLERVNFRRALEGEIARTIATLGEVGSARVHIAMSQQAVFGVKERPAKASVVLKLRNSRLLGSETILGIANLVAGSVEGLRPDAVVIIDSFGRSLSTPREITPGNLPRSGPHAERSEQLERDLTNRVVALLEPVVGAGRVRANVAVSLIAESEETTQETFDPNNVVIRSRQVSGDSGMFLTSAGGLSGARSNLPETAGDGDEGGTTTPTGGSGPVPSRGAETTNYEISKLVLRTVRPGGGIARLSVAVILDDRLVLMPPEGPAGGPPPEVTADGEAPADADAAGDAEEPPTSSVEINLASVAWDLGEIEKIRGLVAAAVGLDPGRGDQLTVENIAFEEAFEGEVPDLSLWQRYAPQIVEVVRILAVLLLVVLAVMFGVRPVVRRVTTALPAAGDTRALPAHVPRTIDQLQEEMEAQLQASEAASPRGKLDALSSRVTVLSSKEPENAARLLHAWLGEEKK